MTWFWMFSNYKFDIAIGITFLAFLVLIYLSVKTSEKQVAFDDKEDDFGC